MPKALQVVHSFKQAITGGAFEALAAAGGDSLAVPNFIQGTQARILEVWGGNSANACEFSLRSPSFHDNVRGIRMAAMFNPTLSGSDGDPNILFPPNMTQPLYPSDVVIAEVNGTATNNVGLAMLQLFDDLPGADQYMIGYGELLSRQVDNVGIRVSVTAGAAGDYGTGVALNGTESRLKANTDYAILGATGQLPCCTLGFVAPETSGRKIALPLSWDPAKSGGWFVDLTLRYGVDLIPVVNSNNAGNVIFTAADPGGAIATAATVLLTELR